MAYKKLILFILILASLVGIIPLLQAGRTIRHSKKTEFFQAIRKQEIRAERQIQDIQLEEERRQQDDLLRAAFAQSLLVILQTMRDSLPQKKSPKEILVLNFKNFFVESMVKTVCYYVCQKYLPKRANELLSESAGQVVHASTINPGNMKVISKNLIRTQMQNWIVSSTKLPISFGTTISISSNSSETQKSSEEKKSPLTQLRQAAPLLIPYGTQAAITIIGDYINCKMNGTQFIPLLPGILVNFDRN